MQAESEEDEDDEELFEKVYYTPNFGQSCILIKIIIVDMKF